MEAILVLGESLQNMLAFSWQCKKWRCKEQ